MNTNPIKDSGDRTNFDSGAVRDLRVGKGRMDLVPLDIANFLINYAPTTPFRIERENHPVDYTLCNMDEFIYNGSDTAMVAAMYDMILHSDVFVDAYLETAKELEVEVDLDKVTARELVANAILVCSRHFENGTLKYGERNWEKGMPVHVYVDSGARHYIKMLAGFMDEPHHLAALWNMMCAQWTFQRRKDLNDLPCGKSSNEKAFK